MAPRRSVFSNYAFYYNHGLLYSRNSKAEEDVGLKPQLGSCVIIVRTLYNPWYSRQRHLRLRRRLVVDGAADVRRADSERDGPRGQGGRARLPGQQYREVQGTSALFRLDILLSGLWVLCIRDHS